MACLSSYANAQFVCYYLSYLQSLKSNQILLFANSEQVYFCKFQESVNLQVCNNQYITKYTPILYSFYVSLSLSLSLSLFLSVSLSLFLYVSLILSFSLSFALCLSSFHSLSFGRQNCTFKGSGTALQYHYLQRRVQICFHQGHKHTISNLPRGISREGEAYAPLIIVGICPLCPMAGHAFASVLAIPCKI